MVRKRTVELGREGGREGEVEGDEKKECLEGWRVEREKGGEIPQWSPRYSRYWCKVKEKEGRR